MRHDLLADVMSIIQNAEKIGRPICIVPRSNLIEAVLDAMKKEGYIEEFSVHDKSVEVMLLGRINRSRAIHPRFSVKVSDYEKYEKRYLPSRDIGMIIISTSKGVMSGKGAIAQNLGGKLLAFVY